MDEESQKQAEDLLLRGIPGPLGSIEEDGDAVGKRSRGNPGPGCSVLLALTLAPAILVVL